MSENPSADPPDDRGPDEAWPSTDLSVSQPASEPLETLAGLWAIPALPAPARPPVTAILDQMRRLDLLDAGQLVEAETLSRTTDAEALCRELLRRGWLTALQVSRLIQGQGETLALGGYVLLARLGAGGMGMVFKARHRKLGRLVAVKVIHPDYLASAELAQRFRREVRATARLAHPNVVRALDAGQDGKTHYLVLELVDGADLARVVAQRGPLPVAEACDYVRQVALGLQHAHEQGLVHRDIKPSNLMVCGGPAAPRVKVLDLGLSRAGSLGQEPSGTPLTATGAVMGTPDFVAPEQVRDSKRADIRSDLYSLGCTLYFLLSGRPPFGEATVGLKLLMHQKDEPEPIEALRPDVPAAVASLVRELMAKRPEDRPQTPGEVASVLAAILEASNAVAARRCDDVSGDSAEALGARRPLCGWSVRRLVLAAGVSLALLASLVWLILFLLRPRL